VSARFLSDERRREREVDAELAAEFVVMALNLGCLALVVVGTVTVAGWLWWLLRW
jgi:hypothetical protein